MKKNHYIPRQVCYLGLFFCFGCAFVFPVYYFVITAAFSFISMGLLFIINFLLFRVTRNFKL